MGLSGAERQARWRAKRDAEIASLRKSAGKASSRELVEAQAEIKRLRKELTAATKAAPASSFELAMARGENALLRQQVKVLKAEIAAKPAKPAKPAPQPVDPDSEVAKLQKTISSLRSTLNRQRAAYNARLADKGKMTFKASSLISKALSALPVPTEADREAALKEFNAWKADSKAAERAKC